MSNPKKKIGAKPSGETPGEKIERLEKELAIEKAKVQAAHKVQSVFLSKVSHELRTPLTVILGFTKLNKKNLEEKVLSEIKPEATKAQKVAQRIIHNLNIIELESQRLTQRISDLLEQAKVQASKIE